jgi:hypothetical protein
MSQTTHAAEPEAEAVRPDPAVRTTRIPVQRTGREATWPRTGDGLPRPGELGSWPVSTPPRPRRHPAGDVFLTGLIVLAILIGAALYISGALTAHHTHHAPAGNDPFAVG